MDTIYLVEGDTLTGLADAVRAKTGVSGAMTPAVIGETFENWEVEDKTEQIVDGSIKQYSNDQLKTLGLGAFAYCQNLFSVNLPVCTQVTSSAFTNCSSLVYIDFPKCTRIFYNAFKNCISLTSVSFPACQRIDNEAFGNCTSLVYANFPVCSYIDNGVFSNCINLVSVSLPACSFIGSAFQSCKNITSINLPSCTKISGYGTFSNCINLVNLTLPGSSICTLAMSNAFYSTPIASGIGYIYVPLSLVSSYRTATNWAYFSSVITSIV